MVEPEANSDVESVTPPAAVQRTHALGITGLLLGLTAMGLAIIPAIVVGRPLPNPFAAQPEPVVQPAAEPEADEPKGGLTVEFKSFSVNIGGKKEEPSAEAVAPVPVKAQPVVTSDSGRWFNVAAIVAALIGVMFAAIGQLKEQQTTLTVCAIGCCVAAVTWQYIVMGIVIAVAIALLFFVLANLTDLV